MDAEGYKSISSVVSKIQASDLCTIQIYFVYIANVAAGVTLLVGIAFQLHGKAYSALLAQLRKDILSVEGFILVR